MSSSPRHISSLCGATSQACHCPSKFVSRGACAQLLRRGRRRRLTAEKSRDFRAVFGGKSFVQSFKIIGHLPVGFRIDPDLVERLEELDQIRNRLNKKPNQLRAHATGFFCALKFEK